VIDQNAVAGYRRAMVKRGLDVTFRRISGQAPNAAVFDATVRAIVMDYAPAGDVMPIKREGGISQGARRIMVINADLRAKRFVMPLQKNDKVVVQGEVLNIAWVDPNKRETADVTDMVAVGV
jgi:hypothetical protein